MLTCHFTFGSKPVHHFRLKCYVLCINLIMIDLMLDEERFVTPTSASRPCHAFFPKNKMPYYQMMVEKFATIIIRMIFSAEVMACNRSTAGEYNEEQYHKAGAFRILMRFIVASLLDAFDIAIIIINRIPHTFFCGREFLISRGLLRQK